MTLLALHQVELQHQSTSLFKQLNLQIAAGECHCICGVTGSGKTTLLQLMAMPSQFNYQGQIYHNQELRLGLVMQDPNVQIIRETIGAEIAFGLENLGYPAVNMLNLVEKALAQVGLTLPLDTLISHLSLGQKYRLMVAAQLVFEPNLLFIDEPWAQLDNQGIKELLNVLEYLLSTGVSVVITEHHSAAFSSIINFHWRLDKGAIISSTMPTLDDSCDLSIQDISRQAVLTADDRRVYDQQKPAAQSVVYQAEIDKSLSLLTLSPLNIQFNDQRPVLQLKETLALMAGDIVGLFGENGCGKTSLFNQIVGVDLANQTRISLLGKAPKLGLYGAEVGFLMQRPSRQLFEMTVRQELEFSLKRFGLPLSNATEVLTQLDLLHLASHSPHKMSYGQQHLIALASVLCIKPKVLLLDDPFAGLDNQYFARVIACLTQFALAGGAVIFSSHRPILLDLVSKSWLIDQQQLTEQCFAAKAVSL